MGVFLCHVIKDKSNNIYIGIVYIGMVEVNLFGFFCYKIYGVKILKIFFLKEIVI